MAVFGFCLAVLNMRLTFAMQNVAQGHSVYYATQTLRAGYRASVLKSWLVFGPGQTVNFLFIPAHLRIAFVCILAYVYNVLLAIVAQQSRREAQPCAGLCADGSCKCLTDGVHGNSGGLS